MATPELTWHFSEKPGAQQKPVAAIVHNFAGTQDNFVKHVSLLNDLGFDVVTFDLNWHKHGHKKIFNNFLMPYWAGEIEGAFSEILETRQLIAFCFSGLSFCAISKLPKLMKRYSGKVKALVFDSGPFENYIQCIRNMVKLYLGIKNRFKAELLTQFFVFTWGPHSMASVHENFKKIFEVNPDLPVLSFQGLQDGIVPQEYIHACFENPTPKNFTEVIFKNGGHLTSLKEEPEKYKSVLEKFLSEKI